VEHATTGCLNQRSHLERLKAIADECVRGQLETGSLDPARTAAVIITVGEGGSELARSVQPIADAAEPLARLLPQQAIIRALRETDASAAALLAPLSDHKLGLQLADLDHEQTLTAQVKQSEDARPILSEWDFDRIRWPFRLRQLLRTARSSGQIAAQLPLWLDEPAAPLADERPATEPEASAAPQPVPVGAGHAGDGGPQSRQQLIREMREQLHHTGTPAPSWLH
jgi:hypothetical protein